MAAPRLPHYLKRYRKRAGLSQEEVAQLLGCRSGTKVSRYERFQRRPTLETIFAYEVIFEVEASKLFAGLFEDVRRRTLARMKARKFESLRRRVGSAVGKHDRT